MMKVLLNNQLTILLNTVRTQRIQNTIGIIVGIIVLAVLTFFLGRFVWSFSSGLTPETFEGLLGFGFIIIISMIVLMGLPQVFKGLFDSEDLGMLFAMPIPTRTIFWMKYIQSYFSTPLFLYVVFIVPLFVYGVAIKAPFLYFFVAAISLLAVTLMSLSVIYLLNLLLIRVLPARRANEFLMVMSFLSGMLVFLLIRLPDMILNRPVTEIILEGLPLFPDWMPISWASGAIGESITGNLFALIPLTLLIIMTIILMMLSAYLVDKGFRTGWAQMGEKSSKKRKMRKRRGKIGLNHPIVALGKKEWNIVKRDMREWLVLMPILFFIVFGGIGFFGSGIDVSSVREFPKISWAVAQGAFLFIFAITNGTLAASSIGREGTSFWLMKVLPVTGRQITYGKFWISWLMPLVFVLPIELVAFFVLNWSIGQLLLGIGLKAVVTAGLTSIGLWLGTIGGRYNPTNPNQRLNFTSSILLMVLSYIYLMIVLIPVVYIAIPDVIIEGMAMNTSHGPSVFEAFLAKVIIGIFMLKVDYPVIMTVVAGAVQLLITVGMTMLFLTLSANRFDKGFSIDMVNNARSKFLRK